MPHTRGRRGWDLGYVASASIPHRCVASAHSSDEWPNPSCVWCVRRALMYVLCVVTPHVPGKCGDHSCVCCVWSPLMFVVGRGVRRPLMCLLCVVTPHVCGVCGDHSCACCVWSHPVVCAASTHVCDVCVGLLRLWCTRSYYYDIYKRGGDYRGDIR